MSHCCVRSRRQQSSAAAYHHWPHSPLLFWGALEVLGSHRRAVKCLLDKTKAKAGAGNRQSVTVGSYRQLPILVVATFSHSLSLSYSSSCMTSSNRADQQPVNYQWSLSVQQCRQVIFYWWTEGTGHTVLSLSFTLPFAAAPKQKERENGSQKQQK